jgi:surface antigen
MSAPRRLALLVATAMATAALPAAPAGAAAYPQSTSSLSQQLAQEEAQLTRLNNQVETAQGELDALDRQLKAEQAEQVNLRQQLDRLARLEYQEPVLTLSTILSADNLNQLLTNISQAKLVAAKQQTLLRQASRLRAQDQRARDAVAAQLAQIKAARDQAAAMAERTMAELAAAQASLRSQVQAVAAQASATAGKPLSQPPAGSWPNHFAFGYCTWYVATRRYVPWFGNAIEWWPNARAYGYPEGQRPEVGAIMVEDLTAYGHVAYVTAVYPNGSWTVAEMNYYGWDVVDTRTLRPGQDPVVGFIYG